MPEALKDLIRGDGATYKKAMKRGGYNLDPGEDSVTATFNADPMFLIGLFQDIGMGEMDLSNGVRLVGDGQE